MIFGDGFELMEAPLEYSARQQSGDLVWILWRAGTCNDQDADDGFDGTATVRSWSLRYTSALML
jgi:hypothetical protein